MKTNDKEFLILCQNIKQIRKVYKLTQKEMAQICGTSIYYIQKLEHDILPERFGIDILFNIYDYFGITPAQMFKSVINSQPSEDAASAN